MCLSWPSRPSHQINNSGRPGQSVQYLSSRNSWPMKIIGTPGAVSTSPVPTLARVRASRGVLRIEHADMKLIDDQVAEIRWTEPRIVPKIIARIAHDAVTVRIFVE